jgi:hypothetical protein
MSREIYITPEGLKITGLLALAVFLSLMWVQAELKAWNLTVAMGHFEDQYYSDICTLKSRIDSISGFIGLTLDLAE